MENRRLDGSVARLTFKSLSISGAFKNTFIYLYYNLSNKLSQYETAASIANGRGFILPGRN
jgi:hypothetical protein